VILLSSFLFVKQSWQSFPFSCSFSSCAYVFITYKRKKMALKGLCLHYILPKDCCCSQMEQRLFLKLKFQQKAALCFSCTITPFYWLIFFTISNEAISTFIKQSNKDNCSSLVDPSFIMDKHGLVWLSQCKGILKVPIFGLCGQKGIEFIQWRF